jgi:hypothetical protein
MKTKHPIFTAVPISAPSKPTMAVPWGRASTCQGRSPIGTNAGQKTCDSVSGVALAALQGLNLKFEETRSELKRSDTENAEVKVRLEHLEQLPVASTGDGK